MDWNKFLIKLTSRKFWAALAGFITPLLASFGVAENDIAKVVLIVTGVGSLVVYMFAEGIADSKR